MAFRTGPLKSGQRSLLVTALHARDLRADGDCLETVTLAVDVEGGEGWVHAEGKRRTSAATVGNCGTAAAMWGKLAGESLAFVPHAERCDTLLPPPRILRVAILGGEDGETVGVHEILLEELSSDTDWSTVGWYGLQTPAGRSAGEVRLFMRWGNNLGRDGDRSQYRGTSFRPSRRRFYLHATVVKASGLTRSTGAASPAVEAEPVQDAGAGTELQPAGEGVPSDASEALAAYVAFFVEGFDVPLHSRRSTTSAGDVEVDWGPDGDNALLTAPFELPQPPSSLAVELFDAASDVNDASKHVVVARGACDVGQTLARWNAERTMGVDSWTANEWVGLMDAAGEPAGRLLVRMVWQPVEADDEVDETPAPLRALKQELNALSAAQLLSRVKTELAPTGGENSNAVDAAVQLLEQQMNTDDLQDAAVHLRGSMRKLLLQRKIGQMLQVEMDRNTQQRTLFVSVLECTGLNHDGEDVYAKVFCAGEARETDAAKRGLWHNGAGQTVAFIDVQQGRDNGAGPDATSRTWAIARWVDEEVARACRQSATVATNIKKILQSIDEDRPGRLDLNEFKNLIAAMGVEVDDDIANDVIRYIHKDCGSTIDEDDFMQWWVDQHRKNVVTGAATNRFARFKALTRADTLAQLSGSDEEPIGEDQLRHAELKATASGTVLPSKLRIHVYCRSRQTVGVQEKLLGVVGVNLDDPCGICLAGEEDCVHSGWFSLAKPAGKAPDVTQTHSGQIRLTLRWSLPTLAETDRPWQLDATLFQARNLPKTALLTDLNTVGSNSPYVRFRVEGINEETYRRQVVDRKTSTVVRGGSQPKWGVGCGVAERWNQVMGESVHFNLADPPPSLGVELWNDDPSGDTLIGLHLMEIGSSVMVAKHKSARWDSGAVWCDLHDPETGAKAGKVQVQVEFYRKTDQEEKHRKSLRLDRAAQTVHLLQDQYAHGGGYDTRTVLYTPGDVKSLLCEASRRFQRQVVLYREVSQLDAQHGEANEELRRRVAFEKSERWVEMVLAVQESSGSASKSVWQKWVGSKLTTEVAQSRPAAIEKTVEVLLAEVKPEDDLSALLAGDATGPLWAVDSKSQAASRMSLGTEAAAARLQAAVRGRRARAEVAKMRNQVLRIQALARARKARTMVCRRRRRKQAMSVEDQMNASKRMFAEQISRANSLLAGMNNLVTEIHTVADKNEDSLRGTAGWAVFSKATEEAAEALMNSHRAEVDKCVRASEMEVLLGRYQASNLCKQEVVAETEARIEAAKNVEARALKQLQTQVAACVAQIDELVQKTEAMGKNGWRKRREPVGLLLRQTQQAIDEAATSRLVPEDALAKARKHRQRAYEEEQARILVEDAAKLAGEKSLDAAFAQTMKFLFSPAKTGSFADGLTASDRKRQSEENTRCSKTGWRSFNEPDVLRDGKKLGVFIDGWRRGDPELGHRSDRLIRSAPSNEYISASYEKMIFDRYPEERGSRYQLELERRRNAEKDHERRLEQEIDSPGSLTARQSRLDSANDPFRSLLPSKPSERLAVHPLLGPLPPEESGQQTPSHLQKPGIGTPIKRDHLGFTPSTCAGSQVAARGDFLEGWVQFGVQSLRSGEPLPPLAGANPARLAGLRAAKGKRSLRKVVRSAGAIESLYSGVGATTPTARLSFSNADEDDLKRRPHSQA